MSSEERATDDPVICALACSAFQAHRRTFQGQKGSVFERRDAPIFRETMASVKLAMLLAVLASSVLAQQSNVSCSSARLAYRSRGLPDRDAPHQPMAGKNNETPLVSHSKHSLGCLRCESSFVFVPKSEKGAVRVVKMSPVSVTTRKSLGSFERSQ